MSDSEKGDYPADYEENEEDESESENNSHNDSESENEEDKEDMQNLIVDLSAQRPDILKDDSPNPNTALLKHSSDGERKSSQPRKLGLVPASANNRLARQRQSLIKFADAIANVVGAPVRIVRKRFHSRVEHFRERFYTSDNDELQQDMNKDDEALPDVLTTMTEMWTKNVFDTAAIKDVPRLIDRVCVKTGKDEILLQASDHDFSTRKKVAIYIGKVTKAIAENLEEEEDADAVAEAVDALLSEMSDDSESDQTDFVEKLFTAIGEDSRTVKVFKCIHQSVIAQAIFVISKGILGNKHFFKDVRGPEGWRIMITLDDYVQVCHTRREQSIFSGDNHWEFEWEVILSFDKAMKEMTGARLLITDLELSDTMDELMASELSNLMQNGNLFIS
mmetsp:Transcript_16986/g.19219  ORF Transcript_16986/g.19219 Transcript_16986/m.19219 type:complete len:391 (+) Transcript_16986:206-1378(+)|eukprot:CAMPEP_0204852674 /NCGR_PEP_ID=MMETSP1347-20130617/12134_1 /ASSEMBLY_ACC=CAM_ASM_000690 /TAXON_ID=215587 /ORGANISM="Aplanochytrium stocchinoi, Strain GSBS06" /LENGTH=390 /DNA_ID=CAMNT_0051997055 /DNA_START=198 /DNA_END=1370 /DNA_ORIENTATION=-